MAAEKKAQILSFEGLISAPFVGYKPNGQVNPDIIPKYVDHLVSQGVTGIFVNGTTGEGLSLTVSERKAVAEAWMKAGKNKFKLIIMQIGANSLEDTKELASHAEKIDVTGIASLPPLFYKPQKPEDLAAYFKEISKAAPNLPVMLYHIPSFSSVEFSLGEWMPKIRKEVPNFCGAKFTSTEVRDLLKCHSLPGEPFKLLSGYDEVLLPCLSCGVTAAVGATYNFMAPVALRVLDALKKGDIKEAKNIQSRILQIVETLTRHGQGIACLKATMNLLGPLDFGEPRVPLIPLSSAALANLKEDLKNLKTEEWRRI